MHKCEINLFSLRASFKFITVSAQMIIRNTGLHLKQLNFRDNILRELFPGKRVDRDAVRQPM